MIYIEKSNNLLTIVIMHFTKRNKTGVLLIFSIVVIFHITSCERPLSECEGSLLVVNEIPDTTLYVGGEPFRRDVNDPPVVFRNTKDQIIIISVGPISGIDKVSARAIRNDNGHTTIIEVKPLKEGTSEIDVEGSDRCPTREVHTRFTVTVVDTTQ